MKLAQDSGTNQYFAIKIANKKKLKKKLMSRDKNAYTALQTEIAIMKKLVSLTPINFTLTTILNDTGASKHSETMGGYRRSER